MSFDSGNPYNAAANRGAGSADWTQVYATQAVGYETARLADAQERIANAAEVANLISLMSSPKVGVDKIPVLKEELYKRMGLQ